MRRIFLLSVLTLLAASPALGGDVKTSSSHVYRLTVENIGAVDMEDVSVSVEVTKNPHDLISIVGIAPQGVTLGRSITFEINFTVGPPPDDLDKSINNVPVEFTFTIHKSTDGPLYVKYCGFEPAACEQLKGNFTVDIIVPEEGGGGGGCTGPGCDTPDDNESVSLNVEPDGPTGVGFDPDSPIGVLSRGFIADMAGLSQRIKQEIAEIPLNMEGLSKPVLVIPSGALYGMENSQSFKDALEQYVREGGTVVAFTQQHGREFGALPGNLGGYGWHEDESCQKSSVYIGTYHQILSGLDQTYLNVAVDGYFSSWPENAKILLRRAKNDMPAMVMYEYGEGLVIATTLYEDWAYSHQQSSTHGRIIVRDMLNWAMESRILPEYRPGDNANISVEVGNDTAVEASRIRILFRAPDQTIVREEFIEQPLSPGETLQLNPLLENVPASLGIWTVGYELQNDLNEPIGDEQTGARFVVQNPPEAGTMRDFTISLQSEYQFFYEGETGVFKTIIQNKSVEDRLVKLAFFTNHSSTPFEWIEGIDVPAGATQTALLSHIIDLPWASSKSSYRLRVKCYDAGTGVFLGASSIGAFIDTPPEISGVAFAEKDAYRAGETVNLTVIINHISSDILYRLPYRLIFKVEKRGSNQEAVFEQVVEGRITDVNSWPSYTFSYTLPDTIEPGQYRAYGFFYIENGDCIGGVNTLGGKEHSFSVAKPNLVYSASVPDVIQPGLNSISYQIRNWGYTTLPGTLTAELTDPSGEPIWTGEQTFFLDVNERILLDMDMEMPLLSFPFGIYQLESQAVYPDGSKTSVHEFQCSARIEAKPDRSSYRAGEDIQLAVVTKNNGDIPITDMKIKISVSGFSFDREDRISLAPNRSKAVLYPIHIPENVSPGIYTGTAVLVDMGETSPVFFEFTIPESRLSLTHGENENYAPGQVVSFEAANRGGVNTQAEYRLILLDSAGSRIAEETATLSLASGKTESIDLAIPDNLMAGEYEIAASVTDASTGKTVNASLPIVIEGMHVALDVSMDQPVYFTTDSKNVLAEASADASFDGRLNLKVFRLDGESAYSWTTQEDWEGVEHFFTDTASQPGDALMIEDPNAAFNDPDSRIKWNFTVAGQIREESEAPIGFGQDGTIYLVDNGPNCVKKKRREGGSTTRLYALTAGGAEKWRFEYETWSCFSPPVVGPNGDIYVIGGDDLKLIAVDDDGHQAWAYDIGEQGECRDSNPAPVVTSDGTIVIVRSAGLAAIRPTSAEKWVFDNTAHDKNPPVAGPDGVIYFAADKLYAIDSDGSVKWAFEPPQGHSGMHGSPAIGSDGTIYVIARGVYLNYYGYGDALCALDADGNLKWLMEEYNLENVTPSPEGTIYCSKGGNNVGLIGIHPDGYSLWSVGVNFRNKPAVALNGTAYITTNSGEVKAINPDGTVHWECAPPEGRFCCPPAVGPDNTIYGVSEYYESEFRAGVLTALSDRGRSYLSLKHDAGTTADWKSVAWNADLSEDYAVRISTRSADSESALALAPWSTCEAFSDDGGGKKSVKALNQALIGSRDGRWIEMEVLFGLDDYEVTPQHRKAAGVPELHDLTVSYTGSKLVWEHEADMAVDGVENLSLPLTEATPEGRYILTGALTNAYGQTAALDDYVFQVDDNHLKLIFETDKTVYQPGEPICVSGRLINTQPTAASDVVLRFSSTGGEYEEDDIYSEMIDLPANFEHEFHFTFTAENEPFELLGMMGDRPYPVKVDVDSPAIDLSVTPDSAGREPFDLIVRLTNPTRLDLSVDLAVGGDIRHFSIPAGESRLAASRQQIEGDTTIPVQVTGDVTQSLNHAVTLAEKATLELSPAEVYAEGVVEIPYRVTGVGSMDSEFDLTFNVNGRDIVRTVYAPAGATVSGTLSLDLGAGDHTLTYHSIFGGGSVDLHVVPPGRIDMELDIRYPGAFSVLVLGDGDDPQIQDILENAGLNVTMAPVLESEWDGTNPAPDGFDAIILLDGECEWEEDLIDMPAAGQGALVDYVKKGGGLILTEWLTYESSYQGHYQAMDEVLLYETSQFNYVYTEDTEEEIVTVEDHPVTDGLPDTFTIPYIEGNGGGVKPGVTVVASGALLPNAVAVKEHEKGRIVQYAFPDGWCGDGYFGTQELETLLVNSARWAAKSPMDGHLFVGVDIVNSGGTDFTGEFTLESVFHLDERELTLEAGESRHIEYDLSSESFDAGDYTVTARALGAGNVVQQASETVHLAGPVFEADVPGDLSAEPGETLELIVTVRNTGMTAGRAEIAFHALDMAEYTGSVELGPGEETDLDFSFLIPDDLYREQYQAELSIDGEITVIPFEVGGVGIDVDASLDQPYYRTGDTVHLTLAVTGRNGLGTGMTVWVNAGLHEEIQTFVLGNLNTLQFDIPVDEDTADRLSYGIYLEGGRSVHINSLPLTRAGDKIALYAEQRVFQQGDTVVVHVVAGESGELVLRAPGWETTVPVSGAADVAFDLPAEMVSGAYAVEYEFNGETGSIGLDVDGYGAKVLDLTFDKPVYEPLDDMTLGFDIEVNRDFAGILVGWVYHAETDYAEAFDIWVDLTAGRNRVTVPDAVLDTRQAGMNTILYTLYKADTYLPLVTSSEIIEVSNAAVTGVETGADEYGKDDPVHVTVATRACEAAAGQMELYLDGSLAANRAVDLASDQTFAFDLGPAGLGSHTLTARLTSGGAVSEKQSVFLVRDADAPDAPAGLAFTTSGRGVALTWTPNSETDLAGYFIYRNDVCLTAVPVEDAFYHDRGLASTFEYGYRVSAVDASGNESERSAVATVVLDNAPPVITLSPDRDVHSDRAVTLIYSATDNMDPSPVVSAEYPSGTLFSITGEYAIHVTATDSSGNASSRDIVIAVAIPNDNDNDGMPDDWETVHFGNTDRDGTGDFDGDGISDLSEYLHGSDPRVSGAPTAPVIHAPLDGAEVAESPPALAVENSADPDGDPVTYEFELYADEGMTVMIASGEAGESDPWTSWTPERPLDENTRCWWRVRASDGLSRSAWTYACFFVNTVNDPPGAFRISAPENGAETDARNPVLEVTNSVDPDGDGIAYVFEVYADRAMTDLAASVADVPREEDGATAWMVNAILNDNAWYYWRAVAVDEHGLETRGDPAAFFVNTSNDAPSAPVIAAPQDGTEIESAEIDLAVHKSVDLDGDVPVYFFEIDTVNTFDSPDLRTSGPVNEGDDAVSWRVESLTDNTMWFWRVKAGDGQADSGWTAGAFFVNTANDPPAAPVLKNPGHLSWTDTVTPSLETHPSADADGDVLTYRFEIFTDEGLTNLAAAADTSAPAWTTPVLDDNARHYWRVRAIDEHGAASGWMDTAVFYTDGNGVNDLPEIVLLAPAGDVFTNADSFAITWRDSDPDSDARIGLYYDTDAAGWDGVAIRTDIPEDDETDALSWDIRALGEGRYYLYAAIADESATVEAEYASGAVIVDRTAPQVRAEPAGGAYTDPQIVMLAADEPAAIHYTLDGTDPDGNAAVYTGPLEIAGTAEIRFMAIDPAGNRSETGIETYVINEPPAANAGPDISVTLGGTVLLDGSGSADPDNGPSPLAFFWRFADLPSGSALTDADIAGAEAASASFVPDTAGVYALELTVSDGAAAAMDRVEITVTDDGLAVGEFAVLAVKNVWIGQDANVLSGRVGVIRDSYSWLNPYEIRIGENARLADGVAVYGDSIRIETGASVDDVFYNDIAGNGEVRGDRNTPLSIPLAIALPEVPEYRPGQEDVRIPLFSTRRVLSPGSYRDVYIRFGTELVLTGGTYHFRNVFFEYKSNLVFQDRTEAIVGGQLFPGLTNHIGPKEGAALEARDIRIYVLGAGPSLIGIDSRIEACVYAPSGLLGLTRGARAEGAFIGEQVAVGWDVEIRLNSGF